MWLGLLIMFIPGLNFAGWVAWAARTNDIKYFFFAFIYSIPIILSLVLFKLEVGGLVFRWIGWMLLVSWIVGLIHALMIRKEVNLKIKEMNLNIKSTKQTMTGKVDRPEELKDTLAEYRYPHTRSPVTPPPIIPSNSAPSASQIGAGKSSMGNSVDINNANEQEIASLPGVGPILAKKAIRFRQSEGPFQSVDHFSQVLGLKPNILQQLLARVVVTSTQPPKTPESHGGRVVDF